MSGHRHVAEMVDLLELHPGCLELRPRDPFLQSSGPGWSKHLHFRVMEATALRNLQSSSDLFLHPVLEEVLVFPVTSSDLKQTDDHVSPADVTSDELRLENHVRGQRSRG